MSKPKFVSQETVIDCWSTIDDLQMEINKVLTVHPEAKEFVFLAKESSYGSVNLVMEYLRYQTEEEKEEEEARIKRSALWERKQYEALKKKFGE